MANPLAKNNMGIPVPMQGNVNAMQTIMGRMQNFQQIMRGNMYPQQMIMNAMQQDTTAMQGVQKLRDKYGTDKSAMQIAQAVCKEQGLDFNQMVAMIRRQ